MIFKIMFLIVMFLLIFICLYKLLVKLLTLIFEFIKDYKKMNQYEKDKMILLFILCLIPFVVILVDANNVISNLFPDFYSKLSTHFDVFSFFTTYISMFANAILLIIINDKERKENTKNLQNSQRPYLDVSYMIINSVQKNKTIKDEKIVALSYINTKAKKKIRREYLTLIIKNNGASVAIIDVIKTKLKIQDKNIKVRDLDLNAAVKRLSIKSGESIYLFLEIDDLYEKSKLDTHSKILKSEIYYKDLFNINYIDSCELFNNKIEVLEDNKSLELVNDIDNY